MLGYATAPVRGNRLHHQGSPGSHRILAAPLQRHPPTQQPGIPAAGPGSDRPAKLAARLRHTPPTTQLGGETVNALTFKRDQSTGADHQPIGDPSRHGRRPTTRPVTHYGTDAGAGIGRRRRRQAPISAQNRPVWMLAHTPGRRPVRLLICGFGVRVPGGSPHTPTPARNGTTASHAGVGCSGRRAGHRTGVGAGVWSPHLQKCRSR